jgi:hypothetical protein
MSLERKDVRAKLDGEPHAKLATICRRRGIEISEFVEAVVVAEVERIAHEAIGIADDLKKAGFSGTGRDDPGEPRS